MLQLSTASELRHLDPNALSFSKSLAQAERRKHFNQEGLDELAANIKVMGVVQPIVVRHIGPFEIMPLPDDNGPGFCIWRTEGSRKKDGDPVVAGPFATRLEADAKWLELVATTEKFEVVAGERRVLGAQRAKLETIPAVVRLLSDSQAHEVQLVENLQREDLHELAEAEGYEALLKRGMTADEIADKVAKSRSHVYARMKLIALSEKCRAAFYEGKISASVALLLARIPVHELQDKAIDKILVPHEYRKEPMTYREAQQYVHDEFTLKLSQAPFPRDDETLVAGAGTCAACPKRTGNQPADLFGDIKSADVCTDPVCFKAKKAAHMKRELEKAKETGQKVIRGAEAKRILPGPYAWEDKRLRNGYVRPSDKCEHDPKKRTYAELAGKDAPRQLLQNPNSGKVSAVFSLEEIAAKLKDKGIKVDKPAKDQAQQTERDYAAENARRELDTAVRIKVFAEIWKAAPAKLDRATLEQLIALRFESNVETIEELFKGLGWPEKKFTYNNVSKLVREQLRDLNDAELNRLACASLVADEVLDRYGDRKRLSALAKEYDVDEKKIRAEVEAVSAPPVKEQAAEKTKSTAPAKKSAKVKGKKAAKKK